MRRRLIVSTALIALAAVARPRHPARASSRPAQPRRRRPARLEREADAVAAAVDDRLERGRPSTRARAAPLVHAGATGSRRPSHGPRRRVGARRSRAARLAVRVGPAARRPRHRPTRRRARSTSASRRVVAAHRGCSALGGVGGRRRARRRAGAAPGAAAGAPRARRRRSSARATSRRAPAASGIPEIDAVGTRARRAPPCASPSCVGARARVLGQRLPPAAHAADRAAPAPGGAAHAATTRERCATSSARRAGRGRPPGGDDRRSCSPPPAAAARPRRRRVELGRDRPPARRSAAPASARAPAAR